MASQDETAFRPMPQGVRGYRLARCPQCWMPQALCICEWIEPIATSTRVVIVMPWRESGRSSNTGRLAHLMLANCEVRLRGRPGCELDLSDLGGLPGRRLLLFPSPDATELRPSLEPGEPTSLVVPDGTWRQARRLVKFEPDLAGFARVHLPPGPPSGYRLRRAHQPHWLCTYEAIARALGVLEGQAIEQHLRPAFEAMVRRSLRTRGRR